MMIEKRLETKEGTIYYWVSENWDDGRDTMFYFPGLTADHTMFEGQFAYFGGKYNLISWDAPGHGKSRPYSRFDLEHATEVILQILTELGAERIIAVGQSFGGYHIQALLARHPEKVSHFVGIGTTPYGEKYYSQMDKFWLRQVGWMGMCYPLQAMKRASAKQATRTPHGYENMLSMLEPYSKKEYCDLMQNYYDAFLADNRDLEITCPVLLIQGDCDKVGKVRSYNRMWHEETGFPLVYVADAGHNANVDQAEEVNVLIDNFLLVNRINRVKDR